MPIDSPRRMSFNRNALAYHQGRPDYPSRVYEILSGQYGLSDASRVLEIGAGSGTATSQLLSRGVHVTAVEPGPGLARVLRDRHPDDTLTIIESEIERAALPAGVFDVAVAANSWHWIDASAALPKLAAALRPGGGLAIWWTIFGDPDQPQTEFRATLEPLYSRYLPDEHDDGLPPKPMRIHEWQAQLQNGGWFAAPHVELIRWTQELTSESARALWLTLPNVAELPDGDRAAVLYGVAAAVDARGGRVDDPRLTIVYYTRRTANA